MLVADILQFLGLIALAVLISLAATPVIVRQLERVVAFPIYPIHHSNNSKRKVYPPNHIHKVGSDSIDGKKVYRNPIPDLDDKYCYERRYNRTESSMLKQPNATLPNKLSEAFHRIILFYRSYYGHSTKVEKNR
jgi:hypothetical protein